MVETLTWYVVYTRPRWEKKVSQLFEQSGLEAYCPLTKVIKQWSDRRKTIYEPLFRGYVFVRVEESKKWEVKNIDGVINYVYWNGKPARVQNDEVDTIKKFLHEFEDVEVLDSNLKLNSKVTIRQGVLMNYNGIVLELMGNKARVKIESMGVQLSAIFEKKDLQTINYSS